MSLHYITLMSSKETVYLPQTNRNMIVACINHKGGAGKTITAQNLAICYAHSGYKVCIVDADPSQNSMTWFSTRGDIMPRIPVVANPNFRTIRATVEDLYNNQGYDIVIIDSPPSLERIAEEIILLAHLVIIPVTPTGGNDIWSTEQIAEKIQEMQKVKERAIPSFFAINKYQPHINVHKMFMAALEHHSETYEIKILDTKLNLRSAYGVANIHGQGVYELKDKKAYTEMVNLANEIQTIFDKI